MYPDSGGFITRAAAISAGYTDSEIARQCTSGKLRKVAPGFYVDAAEFHLLDAKRQHSVRARAAAHIRRGSVVSHISAAAVHGLDLWNTALEVVHLTVPGPTGGSRTSTRHIHARKGIGSILVDGAPTTPLARTVLDCARSVDFRHAVVIGDSALRANRLTMAALTGALDGSAGQTGIAAARRAVGSMDGLSESPGESLSRILFKQHGIPAPILQYVITELGVRVDFYWEEFRIVGEFDGVKKYGGKAEALVQEKVREDAIRDLGYEVVRWIWKDLFSFDRVAARFERAVKRASGPRRLHLGS